MSSARSTVESVLEAHIIRQYPNYVDPVVRAFEDRDTAICDSLRQQGVAMGASEEDIEQVLIQAGLIEPPVTEVADPEGQTDLDTVIAEIRALGQQVQQIKEAAARHGVRIG